MKKFAWILLAASLGLPQAKPQIWRRAVRKELRRLPQGGQCDPRARSRGAPPMSRTKIFDALTTGKMILVAGSLPVMQRMAIAAYLGAKEPEEVSGGICPSAPRPSRICAAGTAGAWTRKTLACRARPPPDWTAPR
jgi:hypothetical protein